VIVKSRVCRSESALISGSTASPAPGGLKTGRKETIRGLRKRIDKEKAFRAKSMQTLAHYSLSVLASSWIHRKNLVEDELPSPAMDLYV
jgi:hypothetical protein